MIYSFPKTFEKMQIHMPNIVSLIQDNEASLDQESIKGKGIVYFYDAKINRTFFLLRIEGWIYLVIMFMERRKKNDKLVNEFVVGDFFFFFLIAL